MEHLTHFSQEFLKALRSLLPIVAVVVVFQLAVFREVPAQPLQLVAGLLVVGVGIALFRQGLDLSVFPVGKNLANQFACRGALQLLPFGFAIGTALGIGLASAVEGRDGLIDGFGLIAFAFPIISVLGYAMILERIPRLQKEPR